MEQSAARLAISIGVLLVIMTWELIAPARKPQWPRRSRWPSNLGLAIVGAMVQRLILPLGAMSVALFAARHELGLLPQIQVAQGIKDLFTIIVLDLAIYWQHRVTHLVPWLWRLHLVHHADEDVDGTTALRFHPVEILLSLSWKSLLVLALGPTPETVWLFEVLLNGLAIFNHANGRLPTKWDKWLRFVIVTPAMHRVHHSVDEREQLHNFGFNLTIWDRLFGSYQTLPQGDPLSFPLGLKPWRGDQRIIKLKWLLLAPFLR